jgi:ferredoxin
MRVAIDRDRCAGQGLCYMVAPGVFTDDEDGYGRPAHGGELSSGENAYMEASESR